MSTPTLTPQQGFSDEDAQARDDALRNRHPYRFWRDQVHNMIRTAYREGRSPIVIGYSTSQDPEEYFAALHEMLLQTYGAAASLEYNPDYSRGVVIRVNVL